MVVKRRRVSMIYELGCEMVRVTVAVAKLSLCLVRGVLFVVCQSVNR